MNIHIVGMLALIFTAGASASAQDPDSVIVVPGVVAEGVKPVTTVGGTTAILVKVDSLALPPAPSFEEILRAIPMFHVRTNSRGEAEISVRGSESRQVAVLVDGVPLTLAWDARTDVSVLPGSSVQDVSLVRGLSSMLHGPNVLGGVVEVSVGRSLAQSPRSNVFSAGVDHTGGYGAGGSFTLPHQLNGNQLLFRGGASFRKSPGQPLASGVREPLLTSEDLRLNTDTDHTDGFLALRYLNTSGAWASFSASSFEAERGIAAELDYDDARFWRYPHISRLIGVVSGGTGDRDSPFGGRGDVELSLGYDAGKTRIDAYTDRTYEQILNFDNSEDRTLTLRALADQTLGTRGDLRLAFTSAEIRHDEFLPALPMARYRQRLVSIGAETNWTVLHQRGSLASLRMNTGVAFDAATTPESGGREPGQQKMEQWGARVGATAVLAGGNTLLHGGVSSRGRFPALRELYSGSLDRFQPNPNLEPERLVAVEAGVTQRLGNGQLQLVGFRHDMNDAVVRITLPDLTFLRVNRNRLESIGMEMLATQTLGPIALVADLTVQSVELTDTEANITNQPENLPEIYGQLNARFPLLLGINGNTDIDYIGKQFCIDPATGADATLKAGTHINLQLTRRFGSTEISAAVDNLANEARYDQCRLPQPGRLFRVQVRLL